MIKFWLTFFGIKGSVIEQSNATTRVLWWVSWLPLVVTITCLVGLGIEVWYFGK